MSVLIIRVLLFWVYIRDPCFLETPIVHDCVIVVNPQYTEASMKLVMIRSGSQGSEVGFMPYALCANSSQQTLIDL